MHRRNTFLHFNKLVQEWFTMRTLNVKKLFRCMGHLFSSNLNNQGTIAFLLSPRVVHYIFPVCDVKVRKNNQLFTCVRTESREFRCHVGLFFMKQSHHSFVLTNILPFYNPSLLSILVLLTCTIVRTQIQYTSG